MVAFRGSHRWRLRFRLASGGTGMSASTGGSEKPRFVVFRAKDARAEAEAHFMDYEPITPVAAEGARKAQEAGVDAGHELKLLFSVPGFSLSYVWFKSGFPLPRHSH